MNVQAYLAALGVFDKISGLIYAFYRDHGYYPDRVQVSNADYDTITNWSKGLPRNAIFDDPETPRVTTISGLEMVRGEETTVYRESEVPEKLLWQPPR